MSHLSASRHQRRLRQLALPALALFTAAALTACSDPSALTGVDNPTRPTTGDSAVTPTPNPPTTPVPPARDAYTLLFDQWVPDAASYQRPWLVQTNTGIDSLHRVMDFSGAFDASVSPDGQSMVFTCTTGHGTTLCKAALDSAVRAQLPGAIRSTALSALVADQPAISPDGQQVAFRGWQPGGTVGLFNPADIYVMNIDGTNVTRLTSASRGVESFESPAWSPRLADGSYRLAFSREYRNVDGYAAASLASMRSDGSDVQRLVIDSTSSDREPSWSPDGMRVAFVRRGGSVQGDLWVVELDADARPVSERALLDVEPDGVQRSPSWSPDGKRLAFVSAHEILGDFYDWQVYSVNATGNDVRRHTSVAHEHANPVWVPVNRLQ
ncbi:MAG TPA: hypothetical protein VGE27_09115 [Gemmatimonas sp.]|uniref:hypothetical protein n=1 Tax=Gemmatimonas sp. TaxID=1962908 RepID=UPI002EDB6BD6